ncbi:MAG: DUF1499 domain-containing protein [Pseudomonadales bacterium]|nr:DUF1499 domain-containing protein [Pseudomonadales bacterium]
MRHFTNENNSIKKNRIKKGLNLTAGVFLVTCINSTNVSAELMDNTRLTDCPKRPNCVVSHNKYDRHFIEPIDFDGEQIDARHKIISIIQKMKGSNLVEESQVENSESGKSDIYLKVEFKSKLLKFVDDTEFLIGDKSIQIRSASRLGYSDMGVNRKRLEKIRREFYK